MERKIIDKSKIILPAICCIGYNRPESMRRLLTSVINAVYDDDNIPLIISIDESNKSDEVEAVARSFEWKHGEMIIKRYPQRMGLKEHCLRCGDLSIEYGALIFLEDDVTVAPGYYRYTKAAVNYYRGHQHVFAISLYSIKYNQSIACDFIPSHIGYDTYFLRGELSHGHCWMGESWKRFRKWKEQNEQTVISYNKDMPKTVYSWNPKTSWSRYVMFYLLDNDDYYVNPYFSYATNMSEVGVHAAKTTDICQIPLTQSTQKDFKFARLEEGVRYDSFLERLDFFSDKIAGINLDKICLDLNGMRYDWSGYKYLLSIKDLEYKVIEKYGINMEPVENNIIYGCKGDAIKLYEVPADYKPDAKWSENKKHTFNKGRVAHLLNKYPSKMLLISLIQRIKSRIIK